MLIMSSTNLDKVKMTQCQEDSSDFSRKRDYF